MIGLQLRLARMNDLQEIMTIFNAAIAYIGKQGSPQWQNGYGPQVEQIKQDINKRQFYVFVDELGKILAVAALVEGVDPVYTAIDGTWQGNEAYISIHRVAVSAETMGKGIANLFLKHLVEQCQQLDYQDIRIDTHELNIGMQKVILANGFQYRGQVVFPIPFGERLAYQLYLG